MNEDFIILLLYKRLKGEINQAEKQELDAWLAADPVNVQSAEAVERAWHLSESFPQPLTFDLDKEFEVLKDRIHQDENKSRITIRRNRFNLIRMAAAIILLLVAGVVLWNNLKNTSDLITQSTTSGEVKSHTLPDGSIVWLNENTTISYASNFQKQRKLNLSGEAFFEVVKNEQIPFAVETAHSSTTVLGTSFNLKALPNDDINTLIVKTGKVRFQPKRSNVYVELSAGQTSSFNSTNGRLEPAAPVNDYNALFWKTGEWYFDNVPLATIQKELLERFKVNLTISETLQNCTYTSTFILNESSIEQSLNNMALVFGASLKKTPSNSYQLSGGACN